MKARVMEELGSSGAAAVLTKVHGKGNIKNKKCSLASSRRAAVTVTTTPTTPTPQPNFLEEADNQEVTACLERIQSLVPFTSNNKTFSNLDIITSAIFYIRDLQETLSLADLDSPVNIDDNLDLISSSVAPSTTSMETAQRQPSEMSHFSTKCSEALKVSQSPTATHSTSSSPPPPPAMVTIGGGDSLSSPPPLSTNIRQRHPLSVIPSPNTPISPSAANCHGYRISQKS